MKRKTIAFSAAAVIIAILAVVWLVCRPRALGNINHSFDESVTSSSNFTFSGTAGEKIKFDFASDVKGGELDIVLYDSTGNAVYKLDRAKELQTFYTLSDTDTYTLKADYTDFIGKFKVAVYPT